MLLLSFQAQFIGCLHSLLISGKERFSPGWLSNSITRTRRGRRGHLPVWHLSAEHHLSPIFPGGESSWPGLLTVKVRSPRPIREMCVNAETPPDNDHLTRGPVTRSLFWLRPAAIRSDLIVLNDTLGAHVCYFGLHRHAEVICTTAPRRGETLLKPRPKWQERCHLCIFFFFFFCGGQSFLRVSKAQAD